MTRLCAVIGPSYGGVQAQPWAPDHPDLVEAIGVISSGLRSPPGHGKAQQIARLAASAQWHEGRDHDRGGRVDTLLALRRQTLQAYGLERSSAARGLPESEVCERLDAPCRQWAQQFDANSLPVLAGAAEHLDVRNRLNEIRARVLLVQATTDATFPANDATRDDLVRVPAPTRHVALDSPFGHMAAGVEASRWQHEIAWLLSDATPTKPEGP